MHANRRPDKMKLGAFFHPTGHHVAAWMHPGSQIDAGTNFQHYVSLAQTAEAGKFDLMFLADSLSVREAPLDALSRWPQYTAYFEPITLLSGIAANTKHLGLVATASTSYNAPYNVARSYASLDHISGGRAGWNVVTSGGASVAANFDNVSYPHDDRYDRAVEFAEVVRGLWDSWDDDAFVRDRESGRYFDPAKVHTLDHVGVHFSVKGPLNAARPPQGHPVLFQAGGSPPGRELAARLCEAVFTPLHTLDAAQSFYSDVKARMERYGRRADQLKIMPGLNPVVGRTRQEALDKHQYLQSLIHPDVGLELLSNALGGYDLSGCDPDGPLPDELDTMHTEGGQTQFRNVLGWARNEKLTIRQLYERFAGARGQRTVIGTGEEIADQMQSWFESYGVDGYLIQPPYLPGGLDEFVADVIPVLQDRGLFRTEYEGSTLRENLGLDRPKSRYARSV
ncbi:LLM class flavin-dependent oxidoreductase [Paraburkholderia caballeronis]|uniref:LLM class flavin-dependent oxidoreductase n=1 Tax=Paraburkholderia caballeronis TaxID=416943 RepID=UPI0010CE9A5D|nr:LLM class flavin-dependent oxidoreductase [Paraburkholderia caballeronis]TDV05485.1 FMN-dependent oxidoreductase (nitrilotriacetate monooxygenase family) [Paraburkholderia caballeronis]TDV09112.1 FMN-dependent oxidoreductase (nitrilotriacetate monooxygenase family) [Paraburkholderia caballeronis]TDV20232.1 FMN-dependent oxidoreductase (nitrilotriacetate monooxygenase family) [Paraburkholderia caballeronis]